VGTFYSSVIAVPLSRPPKRAPPRSGKAPSLRLAAAPPPSMVDYISRPPSSHHSYVHLTSVSFHHSCSAIQPSQRSPSLSLSDPWLFCTLFCYCLDHPWLFERLARRGRAAPPTRTPSNLTDRTLACAGLTPFGCWDSCSFIAARLGDTLGLGIKALGNELCSSTTVRSKNLCRSVLPNLNNTEPAPAIRSERHFRRERLFAAWVSAVSL
jgi:hypothetical protein